jgi:hypothetical protein
MALACLALETALEAALPVNQSVADTLRLDEFTASSGERQTNGRQAFMKA